MVEDLGAEDDLGLEGLVDGVEGLVLVDLGHLGGDVERKGDLEERADAEQLLGRLGELGEPAADHLPHPLGDGVGDVGRRHPHALLEPQRPDIGEVDQHLPQEERVAVGLLGQHRRRRPRAPRGRPAAPGARAPTRRAGRAGPAGWARPRGAAGAGPPPAGDGGRGRCPGRCRRRGAASSSPCGPRTRSRPTVAASAQWRSSSTSTGGTIHGHAGQHLADGVVQSGLGLVGPEVGRRGQVGEHAVHRGGQPTDDRGLGPEDPGHLVGGRGPEPVVESLDERGVGADLAVVAAADQHRGARVDGHVPAHLGDRGGSCRCPARRRSGPGRPIPRPRASKRSRRTRRSSARPT